MIHVPVLSLRNTRWLTTIARASDQHFSLLVEHDATCSNTKMSSRKHVVLTACFHILGNKSNVLAIAPCLKGISERDLLRHYSANPKSTRSLRFLPRPVDVANRAFTGNVGGPSVFVTAIANLPMAFKSRNVGTVLYQPTLGENMDSCPSYGRIQSAI